MFSAGFLSVVTPGIRPYALCQGMFAPHKRVPHDLSYGYKLLDLQIIQSHYSGPDMNRRGAISHVDYSGIT